MLEAVIVLAGIACLAALGLGLASLKLAVAVDPRVAELDAALPGVNCGACGYAGCTSLARALAAGKEPATACLAGGAEVAATVAAILGVAAGSAVRRVAVVHCKGATGVALDKGVYHGVPDCRAAALVGGGPKLCGYGCLGLGTCERACPFDAIHVGSDGLAHVDRQACTGCGNCVKACPKRIIDLMPDTERVYVRCSSPLKGKAVKSACPVGCIGCTRCVNTCPVEAIAMAQGLARIDPEKCISCGLCVGGCPTGNIDDLVAVRHKAIIDAETCIGCTKCAAVCPVEAITGETKQTHAVDQGKCVACGRCLDVCPVAAVGRGDPVPRAGASAEEAA
ncbi:MAG TPA: RnfABCDGE type electron transport complex subunit B [Deferrisomatales bacterium]|nr:RnfABCDGE type electron transport complex subunit B [Deferrisomatales bacterium]